MMFKFKVKGKDVYETLENGSFLLMGIGIAFVIAGFTLSVSAGSVLAGTAAILGSFIFFVALVALILTLFVKEIKTEKQQPG